MAVSQNVLVPLYQDVKYLFMADLEEKMSSLGQHAFSTTSAAQRIFKDKHVETIWDHYTIGVVDQFSYLEMKIKSSMKKNDLIDPRKYCFIFYH